MKITQLRKAHEKLYTDLLEEKVAINTAKEMNRACAEIIKTYSTQLKYAELRGEKPQLDGLED